MFRKSLKRMCSSRCLTKRSYSCFRVWSPEALSKLISYFSPGQTDLTKQDAIYYGCLVVGISLTNSLVRSNFDILLAALSLKARAAVSSLLYRKSLKVSSESLSDVTAGKIVTILSKDTDILESFFRSGNGVWIAMIKTGVICYLVYQKIGMASFSGIAFFVVIFPLQGNFKQEKLSSRF